MPKIRVDLESVQVTDGQGVAEGDLELRIQVQEGKNRVVWPSLNGSVKVDKKGPPHTINNAHVATYEIASGTLSKRFTIEVTEVDKGLHGQDDIGQGTIILDLSPNMKPQTKYATIDLKRPNMSYNGQVKVALTAQQVR
ncbi:MAG: hypothetical protein DCC55_12005 [Chloroflexi bacterium]|nr:MAG: hypothetical protein DCC55_12005 [Chloroflexota bacterium]